MSAKSPFSEEFYTSLPHVYLDSAGRSVSPKVVEAIGAASVSSKSMPWLGLADDADNVRKAFASIIQAESDSISFSPCTSYSISLAAHNLYLSGRLQENDEILVLADEMSSAIYPWQYLFDKCKCKMKVIMRPELNSSFDWTHAIVESINSNVAVVAVPNVHWCDGALINLRAINDKILLLRDATGSNRPYLVVDATQSLGVLPLHVDDSPDLYSCPAIDFLACSTHKWLCGPYGVSLMYLHPRHHRHWLPLSFHERNHLGAGDVHRWDELGVMDNHTGRFPTALPECAAERLDIGGRPNPILLPMVRVALGCILRWNCPEEACILPREYCRYLTNHAEELLRESIARQLIAVTPRERRCDHILGLRLLSPALDPSELRQFLRDHQIHVAVRCGYVRVSPYLYNTAEDVGALCSRVSEYIRLKCP